jgi:hypothetical protein
MKWSPAFKAAATTRMLILRGLLSTAGYRIVVPLTGCEFRVLDRRQETNPKHIRCLYARRSATD